MKIRSGAIFLAGLCLASGAIAQNVDLESVAGLSFNFSNPGARSLGMGGAFIALSDDATAAEANPAGLTSLTRSEFSLEGRSFETVVTYPKSGTYPDITYKDYTGDSREEISFASVVIPTGNLRWGLFYHRPLSEEATVFQPFGSNEVRPCVPPATTECGELLPFNATATAEIETWGLAAAWQAGSMSLGVTARYQSFTEEAAVVRESFGIAQVADDDDITFVAGLRWSADPRFGVGAVYKQGAEFDTEFAGLNADVSGLPRTTFHVPDVFGAGVFYRPTEPWVLVADVSRVDYSNLTDDFVVTGGGLPSDFTIDDGTEIHVGTEYSLIGPGIALRAGWWREPAHSIEYRGPTTTNELVAQAILFPEGEEQDHFAVGVGFFRRNYSIDVGYDDSDRNSTGSVSFVWRFR